MHSPGKTNLRRTGDNLNRLCGNMRHQSQNRGEALAGSGDLAGTDFGKVLQDRQDILLLELGLGGELVGKLGLGHGFGIGLHGLGLHRGLHCRSHVFQVGWMFEEGFVKA